MFASVCVFTCASIFVRTVWLSWKFSGFRVNERTKGTFINLLLLLLHHISDGPHEHRRTNMHVCHITTASSPEWSCNINQIVPNIYDFSFLRWWMRKRQSDKSHVFHCFFCLMAFFFSITELWYFKKLTRMNRWWKLFVCWLLQTFDTFPPLKWVFFKMCLCMKTLKK